MEREGATDSLAERNTGDFTQRDRPGEENGGGERESPNAADGFVGNARLRDASRGNRSGPYQALIGRA